MTVQSDTSLANPNDFYQKLDRAAIWLLVGEFGLVALLLVLTLLVLIGNLVSDSAISLYYGTGEIIALIVAFLFGFAYLANLFIGVIGLVLYAVNNREGYPGTGHLINWFFLSGTLVIALLVFVAMITSM